MPEFKVGILFGKEIEDWLNNLRSGGYFVRVESILGIHDRDTHSLFLVVVFRYIPSQKIALAADVAQPTPWDEPTIGD